MKQRPKAGLLSSRKSQLFFSDSITDPKLNDRSFYYHLSKSNMLLEDVSLGAFPVPGYPSKFKAILDPPDIKLEERVADALPARYSNSELTQSIYEFGNQCCGVLMAYGFAPYELVYLSTKEGDLDSFEIVLITPSSFQIRKNKFRQYIPHEIAVERNLESQYIDFPEDSILLFELPETMKSRQKMLMDSLAFIGENIFPPFAMENLRTKEVPFSTGHYLLAREIALAKATKSIGWNARNYGTEYKSEYYVWYRQLIYYGFLCDLREMVIRTLNDGLKRVGKVVGFETTLILEGLPNRVDSEDGLKKLREGNLSTFTEILESFR